RLGREQLGRGRQFGLQSLDLGLEAIGVTRATLRLGSAAVLLQLDDLELQTNSVVFQSRVHHRHRAYPRPAGSNLGENLGTPGPGRSVGGRCLATVAAGGPSQLLGRLQRRAHPTLERLAGDVDLAAEGLFAVVDGVAES